MDNFMYIKKTPKFYLETPQKIFSRLLFLRNTYRRLLDFIILGIEYLPMSHLKEQKLPDRNVLKTTMNGCWKIQDEILYLPEYLA